jgi:hypothetical protein
MNSKASFRGVSQSAERGKGPLNDALGSQFIYEETDSQVYYQQTSKAR